MAACPPGGRPTPGAPGPGRGNRRLYAGSHGGRPGWCGAPRTGWAGVEQPRSSAPFAATRNCRGHHPMPGGHFPSGTTRGLRPSHGQRHPALPPDPPPAQLGIGPHHLPVRLERLRVLSPTGLHADPPRLCLGRRYGGPATGRGMAGSSDMQCRPAGLAPGRNSGYSLDRRPDPGVAAGDDQLWTGRQRRHRPGRLCGCGVNRPMRRRSDRTLSGCCWGRPSTSSTMRASPSPVSCWLPWDSDCIAAILFSRSSLREPWR